MCAHCPMPVPGVIRMDGDETVGPTGAGPRSDARRGASMLAVGLAVFAAGLAVAIGVPLLQNAVRKARASSVATDLRAFAQAFESHVQQHGSWPPATRAAGEVPAGMGARLGATWSQPSSMGWRYLWAPDSLQRGRRYRAAIVLWTGSGTRSAEERGLLEEIDRQIDDGDLERGRFQLGYRDAAFLVLER